MGMLNPSGGILYHARALRYRRGLWQPFINRLHTWLMDWQPARRTLLLVGPSMGHCLRAEFLARFPNIVAVDPDPLANIGFRARYGRHVGEIRWDAADYFSPRGGRFDFARSRPLWERHPNAAVLFCNFLGQLKLLDEDAAADPSFSSWKHELAEEFAKRPFASFHDRLSGPAEPRLPPFNPAHAEYDGRLSDESLLDFYSASRLPSRREHSAPLELLDHLTGDLFPEYPRWLMRWELLPGLHHLVEAVRSPG